jgi:DNA-binding protein YbaB
MKKYLLLYFVLMQMASLFASELNMQDKMEALVQKLKKELYQKTISGCKERLTVKEILNIQEAIHPVSSDKKLVLDEDWQNPEYILMLNVWKYNATLNKGIRTELRALGIACHYNIEYPRTIKGILFFKNEEALKMLNAKDLGLILAYLNYLIINDSPIAQSNPSLHESFEVYANNYNRDLLNNSQLIYGG